MRTAAKAPATPESPPMIEEELVENFRKAGERRAVADAALVGVEERRKVLRSVLMRTFALEYQSAAAQEREAYATDDWQRMNEELVAATLEKGRADADFREAEWQLRLYQTNQANERAERRAYQ